MKGRPATDQFVVKKDPSDFLRGAVKEPISAPVKATPAKADAPRPQKIFRLRPETIARIEREIYERSLRGERITQTGLVEEALGNYFAKL